MIERKNRELLVPEINEELKRLAKNDLRIGQIFSIIESKLKNDGKDIFFVENDKILEELKKL